MNNLINNFSVWYAKYKKTTFRLLIRRIALVLLIVLLMPFLWERKEYNVMGLLAQILNMLLNGVLLFHLFVIISKLLDGERLTDSHHDKTKY